MKSKRIQKVLSGKLAFLRNAKELKMDISTDSQGVNIIRRTATGKNIRKEILAEQYYWSKFDPSWRWNGKIYDPSLGEEVAVTDGEYFVNFRTKIDYPGAEEQVLLMPVYVDSVNPEAVVTSSSVNDSKDYILTFNAEDKGSGFDGFVLLTWDMLTEEPEIYVDENGDSYFYGEDYKVGNKQYSKDIELTFDSGAVIIVPFDKANNMGDSGIVSFVQSNLMITNPENGTLFEFDQNITLEYGFVTNVYDSVLDHYEISIDDNEAVDNGIAYTKKN